MRKIKKKQKNNGIRYLLMITPLMWFLTLFIGKTYAASYSFHDFELNPNNIIKTLTLDLEIYSDQDHFDSNYDYMFAGDTVSRNIFIKNAGEMPFLYKQEYIYESGDADFCSTLKLKVVYKYYDSNGDIQSVNKYEGSLSSYQINFSGSDSDIAIPNSHSYYSNGVYEEGEHWYDFEISIPEYATYDVSNKTCDFSFRTVAWQEDFSNENLGFWDEEEITNTVSSADWVPETIDEITIYNHEDEDIICNGITNNANIKIDWKDTTAYDLDYYHLEMFEDILIAQPILSEYSMELPENGDYKFRVKVVDLGENESEWSNWCGVTLDTSITDYEEGDILINEIMWGGTSEHELDSYIELFNNTDQKIDLEGWFIYGSGPSFHPIELTGTIEPQGYYLITHYPTDYKKGNDKAAILDELEQDQDEKLLHIRKQGEKLILKDPLDNTIDETPDTGPGNDGWEAGEASPHGPWRSMERGDDGEGWHSSCQNEKYWDDDEGANYGTPRHENSDGDCEIDSVVKKEEKH